MSKTTLLFICPHGAAKSIMAAAYTAHIAKQYGLELHVATAGAEPDAAIASPVATLLESEGIALTEETPRMLNQSDIDHDQRVISLGCPLDQFHTQGTSVEYWNDVMPPSQNVVAAKDAIYAHVMQLISKLRQEGGV